MCTVLNALKIQLKLTSKQVSMAIEMAVNGTKATTQQIYQKVLSIIQEDINCELILGKKVISPLSHTLITRIDFKILANQIGNILIYFYSERPVKKCKGFFDYIRIRIFQIFGIQDLIL